MAKGIYYVRAKSGMASARCGKKEVQHVIFMYSAISWNTTSKLRKIVDGGG